MNKFVAGLIKLVSGVMRPFFPVKIYGEHNIEKKKCLVVGNHVCGWDPVIFVIWTKPTPFVYKAEFDKNLFLHWILSGLDCVPVHRGEADLSASKSILRLLKDDRPVCLFPEGTRNPRVDCLQPFHTGAALYAIKTKSPLRPFYIWDKSKAFYKNYMIFGEEITLERFYDKPLDKQTLEEATEIIRGSVDELRIRLNEILTSRGVKRRKRTKKEQAQLDAYYDKQRLLAQVGNSPDSGEGNGQ